MLCSTNCGKSETWEYWTRTFIIYGSNDLINKQLQQHRNRRDQESLTLVFWFSDINLILIIRRHLCNICDALWLISIQDVWLICEISQSLSIVIMSLWLTWSQILSVEGHRFLHTLLWGNIYGKWVHSTYIMIIKRVWQDLIIQQIPALLQHCFASDVWKSPFNYSLSVNTQ